MPQIEVPVIPNHTAYIRTSRSLPKAGEEYYYTAKVHGYWWTDGKLLSIKLIKPKKTSKPGGGQTETTEIVETSPDLIFPDHDSLLQSLLKQAADETKKAQQQIESATKQVETLDAITEKLKGAKE